VPTVPRELRAELGHRFDREAMAELATPTLLLVGTESRDWAGRSVGSNADTIPRSQTHSLDGHGANMTAPDLLASEVERFLRPDRKAIRGAARA